MKIKNKFLASLLTGLGHEVKAELVIDDSNGTSLTFPDISDIAEIAEGVAIDAPDGTYVIANGDETITIVVLSGVVTSYTTETVTAEEPAETGEVNAEVAAVLTAVVDEVKALKAANVSYVAELKALKASLKHNVEVPGAAAAQKDPASQFKIID
jgi:hypothetical protein